MRSVRGPTVTEGLLGVWPPLTVGLLIRVRAGMMDQLVTERNRWYVPDLGTIDKTAEVRLADGSLMNFEFKGTRQKILVDDNH